MRKVKMKPEYEGMVHRIIAELPSNNPEKPRLDVIRARIRDHQEEAELLKTMIKSLKSHLRMVNGMLDTYLRDEEREEMKRSSRV